MLCRDSPERCIASARAKQGLPMRQTKFRGNIFVANLPLGFTDEQLAQIFDEFGLVLGAYLARDPLTGNTKGYGLVNLAPEKAAAEAVAAVNGRKVEGRTIEVKRADPDMAITILTRRPIMAAEPEPLPAPTARPAFPVVAAAPRKAVIVEYRKRRVS
jgi:hypothetical protein